MFGTGLECITKNTKNGRKHFKAVSFRRQGLNDTAVTASRGSEKRSNFKIRSKNLQFLQQPCSAFEAVGIRTLLGDHKAFRSYRPFTAGTETSAPRTTPYNTPTETARSLPPPLR